MTRKLATDIACAVLLAQVDPSLSDNDRQVLAAVAAWPHEYDLDECIRAGDVDLDILCIHADLPRPYVFYSVARLEDCGYLPKGAIR